MNRTILIALLVYVVAVCGVTFIIAPDAFEDLSYQFHAVIEQWHLQ